jgi:hypothetical protein
VSFSRRQKKRRPVVGFPSRQGWQGALVEAWKTQIGEIKVTDLQTEHVIRPWV